MNSTKVNAIVQKVIKNIHDMVPELSSIFADLYAYNDQVKVILVGGAVRDAFLDIPLHDLDIEIYEIPLHELEKILKKYGPVRKVGKIFGVLKIDGFPIDWSLPRVDGPGRKPVVAYNPHLSYQEAFARRDLTINALGIECRSLELIDPFNGLSDIEHKILRAPNSGFFIQDPLRYFRVMQFMGRFAFVPNQELIAIGKKIDLENISFERIEEEFYKLFVLSKKPSLGIDWLYVTGRLQAILPEVYALIGVEQQYEWHPEGDVFEHTKQALDAASMLQVYDSAEDRLVMSLAALCHDLGKSVTTCTVDGKINSLGHDVAGVPLAQSALYRMTSRVRVIHRVLKLVRWHMMPFSLVSNTAGVSAYKRLAIRLAPETSCKELALLAHCDKSARNPEKNGPLLVGYAQESILLEFQKKAMEADVFEKPEVPVLMGKDISMYIVPGPQMGKILKEAYALQIEKGITDKEKLITMLALRKM